MVLLYFLLIMYCVYTSITADVELKTVKLMTDNIVYHTDSSLRVNYEKGLISS